MTDTKKEIAALKRRETKLRKELGEARKEIERGKRRAELAESERRDALEILDMTNDTGRADNVARLVTLAAEILS